MPSTAIRKRPLMFRPVSPPADDDDCASLGDCSLDDVHRAFRESHKSHGLTSGSKVSRSFHFSADLTSMLAGGNDHDDHLLDDGEDDANSVALSVMRRVSQSGARPQQNRRKTWSSNDSVSGDGDGDDQSAAPSVVRNSFTLTSAAAQADRAFSKLESFLQSDGTTMGDGDDSSLLSGMTELKNSEKALSGLWKEGSSGATVDHDMGSNYDDMSSVGSEWQMMGDAGDDSSVMTESSHMVGSIMGSVMLGSIMEGGSRGGESKESDPLQAALGPSNWDRRKICLARELEAVHVPVQGHDGHHHDDDDLSVLSMGEAQPVMVESRSPPRPPPTPRSRSTSSPTPPPKRGSLMSTFSVSSGVMKELQDLYGDDDDDDDDDDHQNHDHQEPQEQSSLPIEIGMSPIGYVSFDSVSKHSSSPDLASLGAKSSHEQPSSSSAPLTRTNSVPCLESYQQSTEDGDEIFHIAASELEHGDDDEDMTSREMTPKVLVRGVPALIGTSEFQRSVARSVAAKRRRSTGSSSNFETFYRYAESTAEFLYGQ